MSKTLAIVLHNVRASEKVSIVHLLTREYGRKAYYVYGGKRKGKAVLFTPLALLEIDDKHKPNREIGTLQDFSLTYIPQSITTDIRRTTIALFIAEILYRTITQPETDIQLFDFVKDTVIRLDTALVPENTHIAFLIDYIALLGFAIDRESADNAGLVRSIEKQNCSRQERQTQLDELMQYYSRHIPNFVIPKSLDVLKQVFD